MKDKKKPILVSKDLGQQTQVASELRHCCTVSVNRFMIETIYSDNHAPFTFQGHFWNIYLKLKV